jgi:two-component system sensor histidine kinase TctE
MKAFTSSIRKQLLSWLLIPIMTLWLISGAITYFLAIDFATSAYDDSLLDSARVIASKLQFDGNKPILDLPPIAMAILKQNEKDQAFYQIISEKGEYISGDASVPKPDFDDISVEEPDFRDAYINKRLARIVAIAMPIPSDSKHYIVIQAAETVLGREALTQSILLGVVLPQLLLILLAAAAVWFGVARGLAPLKTLQNAVLSRSPSDLRPVIEDDAPQEVKPLVNAINDLLERLREDREAQKRFVANAAHQLRTPLAGLKTQTELALRVDNPKDLHHSLRQISTSADRATRLVQQLLALARLEPSALKSIKREELDLNLIARNATRELVSQALAKGIDLGFDGSRHDVSIMGDATSLHDLVCNLIENAILYTQDGGNVTVRVANQLCPTLIVDDNGPGIPEHERERVFERFYRILGSRVTGSGLGLAIVREIAEAHAAKIELSEAGKGTKVIVRFPNIDGDEPQANEVVEGQLVRN